MSDAIKKYRIRRSMRIQARMDAGEDINWVTTENGVHIPLDSDGQAVGGPLKGKSFSNAKSVKESSKSVGSGRKTADKFSSGKYTKKQLQDEYKKLIDEKGGLDKITNKDYEEARKRLGATSEEWNNARAYWYVGQGSKKLGKSDVSEKPEKGSRNTATKKIYSLIENSPESDDVYDLIRSLKKEVATYKEGSTVKAGNVTYEKQSDGKWKASYDPSGEGLTSIHAKMKDLAEHTIDDEYVAGNIWDTWGIGKEIEVDKTGTISADKRAKRTPTEPEPKSVRAAGKDWTKESLTELWQGRGYSKREAAKRAKNDFDRLVESHKRARESEKQRRAKETETNYADIFGSSTKVTQNMKDEVSAIQDVLGKGVKIKKASEWDDGEYEVYGKRITVNDKGSTEYGPAFEKYYDYKDVGNKRVYWEK